MSPSLRLATLILVSALLYVSTPNISAQTPVETEDNKPGIKFTSDEGWDMVIAHTTYNSEEALRILVLHIERDTCFGYMYVTPNYLAFEPFERKKHTFSLSRGDVSKAKLTHSSRSTLSWNSAKTGWHILIEAEGIGTKNFWIVGTNGDKVAKFAFEEKDYPTISFVGEIFEDFAAALRGVESHTADLRTWESIKDSSRPDDFASYVRTYPSGKYLKMAEARLRELERARREEEAEASRQREKEAADRLIKTASEASCPAPQSQPKAAGGADQNDNAGPSFDETIQSLKGKLANTIFMTGINFPGTDESLASAEAGDFTNAGCTLTISWTVQSKDQAVLRKLLVLPLCDIDPLSLPDPERLDEERVRFQTTNLKASIKYSTGLKALSSPVLTLRFNNLEMAKRTTRALKHAVTLCGGKVDPF